MSDAYGYGGAPPNRGAIVQALMNVQNPPGGVTPAGVASPVMPPGPAPLPQQGGVAGGAPGPMSYANAGGAAGMPGLSGAPPAGIGQQAPQQIPQMPQPPPQAPLVPDISQQLPPGGLPHY